MCAAAAQGSILLTAFGNDTIQQVPFACHVLHPAKSQPELEPSSCLHPHAVLCLMHQMLTLPCSEWLRLHKNQARYTLRAAAVSTATEEEDLANTSLYRKASRSSKGCLRACQYIAAAKLPQTKPESVSKINTNQHGQQITQDLPEQESLTYTAECLPGWAQRAYLRSDCASWSSTVLQASLQLTRSLLALEALPASEATWRSAACTSLPFCSCTLHPVCP